MLHFCMKKSYNKFGWNNYCCETINNTYNTKMFLYMKEEKCRKES